MSFYINAYITPQETVNGFAVLFFNVFTPSFLHYVNYASLSNDYVNINFANIIEAVVILPSKKFFFSS